MQVPITKATSASVKLIPRFMPQISTVTLSSGQAFPLLGYGTWIEDPDEVHRISEAVYTAISVGYRHLDTAWLYKNEHLVGRGVRRAIEEGIVTREDMFVVTKVWPTNYTRERLVRSAYKSSQELGLGYIDLLLLHFPVPMKDLPEETWIDYCPRNADGSIAYDDSIDMYGETWQAMEELVDSGLVRSIGVSNFSCSQLETLFKTARIKPAVNQVESHPLWPCEEMIALCKRLSVLMTAYLPFGGTPSKKQDGSVEESDVRKRLFESEKVKHLAAKYKKTAGQILLRFHVQRGVAVIPKTLMEDRMIENMQIFDFELEETDLHSLVQMEDKDREDI